MLISEGYHQFFPFCFVPSQGSSVWTCFLSQPSTQILQNLLSSPTMTHVSLFLSVSLLYSPFPCLIIMLTGVSCLVYCFQQSRLLHPVLPPPGFFSRDYDGSGFSHSSQSKARDQYLLLNIFFPTEFHKLKLLREIMLQTICLVKMTELFVEQ